MARENKTRAAGSREATRERQVFDSVRDLPPGMIPDGIEALWVNEEVRGERQKTNLMVRMNRDGYQPLTIDQVPAFQLASLDEDRPKDQFVRWGGQILMGRPKEYGREDRADQLDAARTAEREAIRGNVTDGLDPKLVQPDKEQTRVERNSTRPQFDE